MPERTFIDFCGTTWGFRVYPLLLTCQILHCPEGVFTKWNVLEGKIPLSSLRLSPPWPAMPSHADAVCEFLSRDHPEVFSALSAQVATLLMPPQA